MREPPGCRSRQGVARILIWYVQCAVQIRALAGPRADGITSGQPHCVGSGIRLHATAQKSAGERRKAQGT